MLGSFTTLGLSLAVGVAVAIPSVGSDGVAARPGKGLVRDSLRALDKLVTGRDRCRRLDAADGDTEDGIRLPYVFCDDGVPPEGGGPRAIPVPVKYHGARSGNDWRGLPPPAAGQEVADAAAAYDLRPERGNRISLDVNVTLPAERAPRAGRPVIVFMHGCCGGSKDDWEATHVDAGHEHWHHSNAWFAARGYVVVTFTARGFRDSQNRGSTGTTQLASRRFEINDYQYLAGLLADHDRARRRSGHRPIFDINPRKIGFVGGSYGGGQAWLALTDPTWRSPVHRVPMKLGAVVAKYGWTDLVEALVPSGHYLDRNQTGTSAVAPTDPAKAPSGRPIGVEKQTIVSGLYATGNLVTADHTTFPDYLHEAILRLQQGEPYDGDPTLESAFQQFVSDRSAYFQQSFWRRVANGLRVPLFAAGAWTDPLFPAIETVRFYNKLISLQRNYPVVAYFGDYQHLYAANKPKEWADLCGNDHHVCALGDYRRAAGQLNLNHAPSRVRKGINTRINRFLDHFLKDRGERPAFDVTATTTICGANATEAYPADEPGVEYRAPSWRALSPEIVAFEWTPGESTNSMALDQHAPPSDPVYRERSAADPNQCYTTEESDPGPGVVQVTSGELATPLTLMGLPTLRMTYTATGSDYWVAARLFDATPSGTMTMVTRGVCRVNETAAPEVDCSVFDLFGNGWTFEAGHRLVLEITQADTPFLRRDNFPSTLDIDAVRLELPVTSDALEHDFRR